MTDTPKDKREAALEKIKALAQKRSGGPAGGGGQKGDQGGGKPKRAPKHGGVGHRPQGG